MIGSVYGRFSGAIAGENERGFAAVIPDIKCVSPKEGDLLRGRDPVEIASVLAACGAPALSVVTERERFGGSPELLRAVAEKTGVPVLRKDFITDRRQLEETAALGASAVLLICSMLSEPQLAALYAQTIELGLEPFVETCSAKELELASRLGAKLVGINNRNITSLELDDGGPSRTVDLAKRAPEGAVLVSESGILGVHDAVIDRHEWELVQKSYESKYRKPKHTEKSIFAGYLRCSDCGANMRYKYTHPNPDNHYFSCGKYREGLCGKTHHIRVDVLDQLLLAAIDNAVRFARDFEDEFVKIVVSEKYRQIQLAQRQNQRKLDAAKKREQELDILFSRIYEDNALGKLPDSQYQKLLGKYQEEYDNLLEHIKRLETVVKEEQSNEMEVNNFLKIVQRYTRVNQMTPAILREFIHHIVVHHRETVGKVTEQKVEIHFNFIGEVNLPDVEQRHKLLNTFGKEKREQTA